MARFALRFAGLPAALCLQMVAGAPFLAPAPALAASRPQQMGGTWDLSWKSRRGNRKTGYMVVEQRGSELVAQVYDRGGATATGSIAGTTFTLRGSRLAIPFTVTGRIKGGRMTGILSALGTERRFTGIRRGRR
ncbi:MAG TPA: hypothetical protein VF547_10720 [Allosphingosinicella sp.]